MGIAQNLAAIMNARYGAQVRQSIHDGISECYSDVSSAKTLAETATTAANTAASNANAKANLANTAADTANTAASNADAKAALADTAANTANTAANTANTAASNADSKLITAASFQNNDIKFTRADNSSILLADAKTILTGDVGPRGISITGITRTSGTGAPGTTDTYTIAFSDNTTSNFSVYNGDDGTAITGIARTSGTGAPGSTDTYTIAFSDNTTGSFNVYNGVDGTAVLTPRTFTIGATPKTFDGTGNVSWTAEEIGIAGAHVGPEAPTGNEKLWIDTDEPGDEFTPESIGALPVGWCPHDVGDYFTTKNPAHPSTRWPGTTWEAIAAGTFMVAAGDANSDYPVDATGGAASVELTVDQIPPHRHETPSKSGASSLGSWGTIAQPTNSGTTSSVNTTLTGGGLAHENRPPYLAAYVWLRLT